jgi:deazaflavin-dependent oxidoreductase (nitroreductase family)
MTTPTPEELKQFNQTLIAEFRRNAGKVEDWHPLILLTTQGARTNKAHTVPLGYSIDGDRLIIIAAAVGSPNNPAWYHNLLAHPDVTVEINGGQYCMHAVVAEGDERERLFNQHVNQYPASLEFQAKVTRQFPVVILEPIMGESSWAAG